MKVSAPTPTLKQLVYSYTAIAEDSPLKDELNKRIVERIHKFLVDYKQNPFKTICGVKVPAPTPVSRGFGYRYSLCNGQEVYAKWHSYGQKATPIMIDGNHKAIELDWDGGMMGMEEGYYDIDSIDRFFKWLAAPITKSEIKSAFLNVEKEIKKQEEIVKKAKEKIREHKKTLVALLGEGA